jgi:hypothetical protein
MDIPQGIIPNLNHFLMFIGLLVIGMWLVGFVAWKIAKEILRWWLH